MAVKEVTIPDSGTTQKATWNSNTGGQIVQRWDFDIPAGDSLAVYVCYLAIGQTPATVDANIIPAFEALPEVVAVMGSGVFGQVPTTIEEPNHEAVIFVQTTNSVEQTTGDEATWSTSAKSTSSDTKPATDQKWLAVALQIPDPPTNANLKTLRQALAGVTGVTSAHHTVNGQVKNNAVAPMQFQVTVHQRIEPIPVP